MVEKVISESHKYMSRRSCRLFIQNGEGEESREKRYKFPQLIKYRNK